MRTDKLPQFLDADTSDLLNNAPVHPDITLKAIYWVSGAWRKVEKVLSKSDTDDDIDLHTCDNNTTNWERDASDILNDINVLKQRKKRTPANLKIIILFIDLISDDDDDADDIDDD
ncbi:hypothetical protein DPMN_108158 [Dreissena polymorpha]|uniref:Uncharacterized protein n=1 Tax=Dreissena polymorpha TaxID=45954 RepID=A0A9D4QLS4_DREPO|nr:hypothetical protein DPMN_108158 [Dreissena polymorpha]